MGATHPVIDDGESWPTPQRRPRQRRPAHGTTVHASPGSTPATALRHPAVGRGAAVRCVYLLRDAHRLLAAVFAARCAEPLLGSGRSCCRAMARAVIAQERLGASRAWMAARDRERHHKAFRVGSREEASRAECTQREKEGARKYRWRVTPPAAWQRSSAPGAAKHAHRLGVTPVTGTRDGTVYVSDGRMTHGGRAAEMVPRQAPVRTFPATSCRWIPWQGKARTTH